jgi:hypothetical protein
MSVPVWVIRAQEARRASMLTLWLAVAAARQARLRGRAVAAIRRIAAHTGRVPKAVTADGNYGDQAVDDDLQPSGSPLSPSP